MWLLQVNQSDAKSLGFLPAGAIDSNRLEGESLWYFAVLLAFGSVEISNVQRQLLFQWQRISEGGPWADEGGQSWRLQSWFCCSKIFQTGQRSPSPFCMSHGHTSWWFKMFKGNPKVILKSFEVQTKALISSCWSQQGLQITLRIALNFRVPLANQVAYTCLLLEKFYGREHSHTQACANLLIRPGATFTHFEREIVIDFVWVGT